MEASENSGTSAAAARRFASIAERRLAVHHRKSPARCNRRSEFPCAARHRRPPGSERHARPVTGKMPITHPLPRLRMPRGWINRARNQPCQAAHRPSLAGLEDFRGRPRGSFDEQHLAVGRQRPQVVGHDAFQLVGHVCARPSWPGSPWSGSAWLRPAGRRRRGGPWRPRAWRCSAPDRRPVSSPFPASPCERRSPRLP